LVENHAGQTPGQTEPASFTGRLDAKYRIGFLVALLIAAIIGLSFFEPIPQPLEYHRFADTRSWLGIANFGDVLSNVPYALAGGFGLWAILGAAGRNWFDRPADRWPYIIFFTGVALVSAGSAYYHLAPGNERLVWDRLPMTIAFMALFAAFIADRIDRRIGTYWLLPLLVAAGILSVAYWAWTEALGRGDLRWYAIVQFYPIVALPIICWLFPHGRYTTGRHLAWLLAWYTVAKALEHFDASILNLLGGAISGHTLKHLASGIAALLVIRMLASRHETGAEQRTSATVR
jgi:hypothetical protein